MKPPKLKIGQYSGALAKTSTGVLLSRDKSLGVQSERVFWVFDSIDAARETARAQVEDSSELEFSIWDHEGAHVEFIRLPVEAISRPRRSWWRFW